jgi:dihydroneopterin aldolase
MGYPVITLRFESLKFFGFHGLYPGEKEHGNEFEFHVALTLRNEKDFIRELGETADYVKLYELIKSEMQIRRELLETLLTEMAAKIKEQFPVAERVSMTIYKLTAPIPGLNGRVGVSLVKDWT